MKAERLNPALVASFLVLAGAAARADQGFGAGTPGGSGKPLVRVLTLADSGPGSLRAAVSSGNRTVVFDIAGEILLASDVFVVGAFVTIDGTTAPSPGITLRNHGLYIRGDHGAHDVIVRSLRVRDAFQDGIQVAAAAYNVLIDHVSVQNSGDGNIDITQTETRDVTVAWSILAQPAGEEKNMLLAFHQTARDLPPRHLQGLAGAAASTTRFYLSADSSWDASDPALAARSVAPLLPGASNSGPTSVTLPSGTAGLFYLIARAEDDGVLAESNEGNNTYARAITIGSDMIVSGFTAPTSAAAGSVITVSDTTKNQGPQGAGASTTRFYLSSDATWDASDLPLEGRSIPALAAGASNAGSTSVTVPAGTAPGVYHLIARADSDDAVPETRETNNTLSRSLTIQ